MIEVTINYEKVAQLLSELQIAEPVKFEIIDTDTPGIKANLLGDAGRDWKIRLVIGHDDQVFDRLMFAQSKIVRTLLHEVKHIQQFQNWTREDWERDKLLTYESNRAEEEANEFADNNYQKWRSIISLKRPMKSRLSRLSAAEQNVRKSR